YDSTGDGALKVRLNSGIFVSVATGTVSGSGFLLKAGDTMLGQLTLSNSTLSVTGNGFSVGGSTLVAAGGLVGIGVSAPATRLHVSGGDMQVGDAFASTISPSGFLTLANLGGPPAQAPGRLYYDTAGEGALKIRLNSGAFVSIATGSTGAGITSVNSDAQQFSGLGTQANPLSLISSSVTLQGNVFNGAKQLLLLDAGSLVPLANLSGITSVQLAANAVDTNKIKDDSIITSKLLNQNVTTAKIANLAVDSSKLAANSVDVEKLAAGALDTNKIKDDSVITSKILNQNVTTAKLADLNITAAKIANLAVDSSKLAANSVDNEKIVANAVDTNKIKDDSIITSKILNQNVTTAKLADLNVTAAKLANLAVDSSKLAANSVDIEKIVPLAVDSSKLAANSVDVEKIVGGSVDTYKIKDESITTAKLFTAAVTAAKVAANIIDSTKLAAVFFDIKTKAQFDASIPSIGQAALCSNCSQPYTLCIGTAAVVCGYARVQSGVVDTTKRGCGTNE
ncbi:MAG: hypothetical protein HY922_03530, partial [Elusimicrobia bacterium]|nr:hypothetical protein [Elusimicrobiota bacterium]